MSKFKEKYHKAAKDGYLDILREAARKDCDSRDDGGMTPVMWSSFYGHLDALRILMSRGGDPDLCDHLGNTALHHASANGHLPCVSFLVNFGANIWSLDNDMHSALDLAVLREHKDVIDFLDSIVGKQKALNQRVSRKLQQRSVMEAEKRRQQFDKIQDKARRREEKEEQRRTKQRQKMLVTPDGHTDSGSIGTTRNLSSLRQGEVQSPGMTVVDGGADDKRSAKSGFSGNAGVARKVGKKKQDNGSCRDDFRVTQEVGGCRSVRSLSGLRRDNQVLLVSNSSPNDKSAADRGSRSALEPDGDDEAGLFVRPGFGSVAFLSKQNVSEALMSLPANDDVSFVSGVNGEENLLQETRKRSAKSCADSIGTAGSLMQRMANLPWSEDEVENLDDDDDISDLELFLTCNNLGDCMSLLTKEKIDMEALLLLCEDDLRKIGLQLGPRKKILDAITKRKMTLENPGSMVDTYL